MGHSREGPADGVSVHGQQEGAAWGTALARAAYHAAYHAALLSSFNLNTTQGQHGPARLRSSPERPAKVFQNAIPGNCIMTAFGNDMVVVSVWHRLGHHVPADVAPRRANAVQELQKQIMCASARR